MQVVILCGGSGTRAYPYTEHIPKPMLPIGGQPILAHVMRIFAEQGHKEFILSLGYRKEVIKDYFEGRSNKWKVHFEDTGDDADTADRVARCKHLLKDTFFVTYADGIGNIDLQRLLKFHKKHDGLATLTTVPLPSQYGTIVMDGNHRISEFKEKPVIKDYWINAGFFVFEKEIFTQWKGSNLEKEVLPHLGRHEMLYAYKHQGFWKSMDTYKDHQELEKIMRENSHICRVKHPTPPASVRRKK